MVRNFHWMTVFLVLLSARAMPAAEAALRPAGLQCDWRVDPLGVEEANPRLSWRLESGQRGVVQSAFQVRAARRAGELAGENAVLWDSGRVESDDQHVNYAGPPPAAAERVFWSVRVWDGEGRASAWSDPATWTMGLLHAEDWGARWIAGPEPVSTLDGAKWIWLSGGELLDAPPGAGHFRRVFTITRHRDVRTALLRVTADNSFVLHVNGRRAAASRVLNAPVAVDIAPFLRDGENLLAVKVVNGGEGPNPAGLVARLDIEYGDGSNDTIVTDGQWAGADAPGDDWRSAPAAGETWSPARELGPYGMQPWGASPLSMDTRLPLFRTEFEADGRPVARALLFVCGLGHFEVSINGARAGDHVLDPGWTDYADTCLYVPFDVTAMLRDGANAIGVMLGNGLYNVHGGRYAKFTGSYGQPKVILQLRIDYADGTTRQVVTDASWRTAPGPITFSCMYGGEDYDARLEQPGWDSPDFDERDWQPARVVDGPGGRLRAQSSPPVTVARRLSPVSITRVAPGEYAADLGENLSARPMIAVRGEAGRAVTVRVAERAEQPWEGHSYTYTVRGGGEERFVPRFTYFGFQHMYISGVARPDDAGEDRELPQLVDAGAEFITSSAPAAGAFHCDNPLFNDIDAMIDRSVRSNLQSVLTDCPHREKLGWLEVAHLMGPSILYRYDAGNLYRKICADTTDSQLENGMVPDIAPEYTRFSAGFFESAEWGSASVQLPWLLYRWYGDSAVLARQFGTMARYVRYLAGTRDDQGLAKGGLGDWYDWTPERGHVGYAQLTPMELTATAMLFDNARIAARTAAMLGSDAEAEEFAALARQVREDFMAAYYDPENHVVATGSQAALATALHFGLVPDTDRGAVLARLVEKLASGEYRQSTGEVCFRFLLLALAEGGRSDVVYRIINRTDAPGYGWMLRHFGLQTLSECWDKPGSSLNHCMFGHAQEWFSAHVLGIRQVEDGVGFRHVRIAPEPVGDLGEASGHFDSPRGRIAVAWKRTGASFTLDLALPPGVRADVVLPVRPDTPITESGRPVKDAPGVMAVNRSGEHPVLAAGPGEYRFVCE